MTPPSLRTLAVALLVLLALALQPRSAAAQAASCSAVTANATCAGGYTSVAVDTTFSGVLSAYETKCFRFTPSANRGSYLWMSGNNVWAMTTSTANGDPSASGHCAWLSMTCDYSLTEIRVAVNCQANTPCAYSIAMLARYIRLATSLSRTTTRARSFSIGPQSGLIATAVSATSFPDNNVRWYSAAKTLLTSTVGSYPAVSNQSLMVGSPYSSLTSTTSRTLVKLRMSLFGGSQESSYFCSECCSLESCDGTRRDARYIGVRQMLQLTNYPTVDYYSCSSLAGDVLASSNDGSHVLVRLDFGVLGVLSFATTQSVANTAETTAYNGDRSYVVEQQVYDQSTFSNTDIVTVSVTDSTTMTQFAVLTCGVNSTLRANALSVLTGQTNATGAYPSTLTSLLSTSSMGLTIDCTSTAPSLAVGLNFNLVVVGVPSTQQIIVYAVGATPAVFSASSYSITDSQFGRSVAVDAVLNRVFVSGTRVVYAFATSISGPTLMLNLLGLMPEGLSIGDTAWPTSPSVLEVQFSPSAADNASNIMFDTSAVAGVEYTSLFAAPAGYMPTVGSPATFTACPSGTYKGETGPFSCQLCAAGSYAPTTTGTTCLACPMGFYCPTGSRQPLRYLLRSSNIIMPFGTADANDPSDVVITILFVDYTYWIVRTMLAVTAAIVILGLIALRVGRLRWGFGAVDLHKEVKWNPLIKDVVHKGNILGGVLSAWLLLLLALSFIFLVLYAVSYSRCELPGQLSVLNAMGNPYQNGADYTQDTSICSTDSLSNSNIYRTESVKPFTQVAGSSALLLSAFSSSARIQLIVDLVSFVSIKDCGAVCPATTLTSSGCLQADTSTACAANMTLACASVDQWTCRISTSLPTTHYQVSTSTFAFALPDFAFASAISVGMYISNSTLSYSNTTSSVQATFGRLTRVPSTVSNRIYRGNVDVTMLYTRGLRESRTSYSDSTTQYTGFALIVPEDYTTLADTDSLRAAAFSSPLNISVSMVRDNFYIDQSEAESIESTTLVYTVIIAFIGLFDMLHLVIGFFKAVSAWIRHCRHHRQTHLARKAMKAEGMHVHKHTDLHQLPPEPRFRPGEEAPLDGVDTMPRPTDYAVQVSAIHTPPPVEVLDDYESGANLTDLDAPRGAPPSRRRSDTSSSSRSN